MVKLSQATLDKVHQLFPESSWAEAVDLLEKECSDNLPDYHGISEFHRFERIQFAVPKLSRGSLPNLQHMVELAKRDWRDVLMGAGFGELDAHTRWHVE